MSFDVTALPAYTEQNAMDLIVKSVAGGRLAEYANIQDGVKGPTTINILSTDVVFQADGCSRSASGSTTLSQRTITPGAVAIHEDLCNVIISTGRPKIYYNIKLLLIALLGLTNATNSQEIVSYSSLQNANCSGIIANDVNVSGNGICRGCKLNSCVDRVE